MPKQFFVRIYIFLLLCVCSEREVLASGDSNLRDTKNLRLDSYIRFVQPGEIENPYSANGGQLAWTEAELKEARLTLGEILTKAPGLFRLAASDRPLLLFRVRKIETTKLHEGYQAIALTKSDRMYLSDTFMLQHDKLSVFLHELIHAADSGNRVAYSKEFVSFAGDIRQTRLRLLAHKVDLESVEIECRKNRICESFSSITDLNEALAYDVCSFFKAQGYTIPVSVLSRLFRPSTSDINWQRHFKRALASFNENKTGEALLELREAEKIDKANPICHVHLGVGFARLGLLEKSADQYRLALKSFDDLELKKEPNRIHAELSYAQVLALIQKCKEAKSIVLAIMEDLDPGQRKTGEQLIEYCDRFLENEPR